MDNDTMEHEFELMNSSNKSKDNFFTSSDNLDNDTLIGIRNQATEQ